MKKIILTILPLMSVVACSSATPPIFNNQIQNAKDEASEAESFNPLILNVKLASIPTNTLEKTNITNVLKSQSYKLIANTNILCVNQESMINCGNSWYEENAYLDKISKNQNGISLSSRISISGIKLNAQSINDKNITFNITSQLISDITQNPNGEQKVLTTVYKNITTISPQDNIYVIKPYPAPPILKNTINNTSTFNNQNSYILFFNYIKNEKQSLNKVKDLNTKYLLKGGDYVQKPLQVFDDGKITYIKLTNKASFLDNSFLTVDINGEESLVNYRKKGNYLLVDGVFNIINLKYNDGTVVKIINNI